MTKDEKISFIQKLTYAYDKKYIKKSELETLEVLPSQIEICSAAGVDCTPFIVTLLIHLGSYQTLVGTINYTDADGNLVSLSKPADVLKGSTFTMDLNNFPKTDTHITLEGNNVFSLDEGQDTIASLINDQDILVKAHDTNNLTIEMHIYESG